MLQQQTEVQQELLFTQIPHDLSDLVTDLAVSNFNFQNLKNAVRKYPMGKISGDVIL